MARKLGKARALAASLVLAGAAIFSTAASAQSSRDGPARRQSAPMRHQWQAYGYPNYADCVLVDAALLRLHGYICGFYPIGGWAVKPDTGKPW